MSRWLACLVLSVVVLLPSGPAATHPHVWVDSRMEVVFDHDRVTGVRVTWIYDELFSDLIIAEFDRDASGGFETGEATRLTDELLLPMRAFNYYTHIRAGDDVLTIEAPTEPRFGIQDALVRVDFLVSLPAEGIKPREVPLSIGLYDETYFVELMLDPIDPVHFDGVAGVDCGFEIIEDTDNPLYFGFYFPTVAKIDCGAAS